MPPAAAADKAAADKAAAEKDAVAKAASEKAGRPGIVATTRRDDLVADLFAQLSTERSARVAAETKLVKAEKAPCVVCMDQDATHAATPCGHLVMCETCVPKLKGNTCPACRAEVTNYMRIYHL